LQEHWAMKPTRSSQKSNLKDSNYSNIYSKFGVGPNEHPPL